MVHSASTVSIPAVPEAHFLRCVNLVVSANSAYVPPHDSNTLLYIRPLLFGSSAQLALTSPKEFTFAVFIQPGSAYHGVSAQDALVCEDFDRAAPKGVGSAKVGGNYAPVMKYTDQAYREGFSLLLHLDSATNTSIDEFSTSGFVGVKVDEEGKVTLVVPDSANVIASVTTDTCMEIARSLGWNVERRVVRNLLLNILFIFSSMPLAFTLWHFSSVIQADKTFHNLRSNTTRLAPSMKS